ncbi:MAG TPA: 50S ribosomal protein L33 [Candidatus Hydrothermia bacterium]|nr:50S ribosomal protein L33 [Candidatus Hydrothermae bacterium]MDD3648910.1 50S ribosomal protein L33 [Candidatus Hydrothermia bacterium]MDD5572606.1 50S ribosomal protein L33 [Candidatus Hydrothermia bacterium]HOK23151.1 50S ribosomal protein L33 [Candidatus Hydrothermia bacterium]HOL23855.1 50S ribosomal protein L33 [Candidatus Hydrothermia bacterium]
MRVKIALVCSECKRKNYYTTKNKDKKEKLEISKYCKFCGKHTPHKESKV